MIQTAVQNAKTYFMQCGNAIVQPEDEDAFTAEVLYMFSTAPPASTSLSKAGLSGS